MESILELLGRSILLLDSLRKIKQRQKNLLKKPRSVNHNHVCNCNLFIDGVCDCGYKSYFDLPGYPNCNIMDSMVKAGDIIHFKYESSSKGLCERRVLVINPDFNGLMHGIDLDECDQELEDRAVIFTRAYNGWAENDPISFYREGLKDIIAGYNVYRTYDIQKIESDNIR